MNFNLSLTPQEAQVVMDALGQMPYAQVAVLYQRLAIQLQAQQNQPQRLQAVPDPTPAEGGGAQ